MSCCYAENRGFVCSLPWGHQGDHTYLPRPDAVCGISWPNDKEKKLTEHNSIDITLQARDACYGSYDVQAAFAQDLKDGMGQTPNWRDLKPYQRESLEMIATKISRILHGDPEHTDSWVDVAGYANLGAGWKA